MSYTPYNAPLLAPVLGDRETASYFSVQADIRAMLKFETALARAQAEIGMIDTVAADEIETLLSSFDPDFETLSRDIAKDGMTVPGLVRQIRANLGPENAGSAHLHSTSQDVIDTSAMMRMQACAQMLSKRLATLVAALQILAAQNAQNTFMAHTRMQAALPVSADERIVRWLDPLKDSLKAFEALQFPVQMGGPVGSSSAYDGKVAELAPLVAKRLDLSAPERHWHTDRTPMIAVGQWLSGVSGHLGKMGTDIGLMAQAGSEQITLAGGGSSSAMAHKQNPILAETLVTIAQFTSGQMTPLSLCQLHEQERSGSAWMLEWMIMPQLFAATGAGLRNAQNLVESIQSVGHQA